MIHIEQIPPQEARQRLDADEDWILVDVRSVEEYRMGHPPGAFNVPWALQGPRGLVANPDFVEVMKRLFLPSQKLILSCRSGNRSNHAAHALTEMGYETCVNMAGGMVGSRDMLGRISVPGWTAAVGEIEEGDPPGRSYHELS